MKFLRIGPKIEVWSQNWTENEPKKGATMANNLKEKKFRSKLGQGKKDFFKVEIGAKMTKKLKKKKKKNSQHCGKILLKR